MSTPSQPAAWHISGAPYFGADMIEFTIASPGGIFYLASYTRDGKVVIEDSQGRRADNAAGAACRNVVSYFMNRYAFGG